MKKLLTVLCGVVIALSLFVTTGNTVKAAECGCDVSPVLGAEKNKIVAELISSQAFKDAKFSLRYDGISWKGAKNIEVIVNHTHDDALMVGVPYYTQEGSLKMAVFINGVYMGLSPM
ncbi:hypothetical protein [Neobacillus drentensis]|uniref:hypothetical protein n=1 Tax=Neobacillus drentensis TaxID=220684 RepID=UPI0028664C02|nr:hypothetical protein [Neobacillus drentensis]MDR7236760.1 hypothetical protein [Neobacillus drentensis]